LIDLPLLSRLRLLINGKTRGGEEVAYFLAFNVANVLNYAYLVSMGLLLGTESYGLFGALFGLVYLVSALGNTVQIAVARHVAVAQAAGALSRQVIFVALVLAAVLAALVGLVFLALSPTLAQAFHSPSEPLLWTSLAIVLSILMPAGYGVLQGKQNFHRLGASLLAAALFRIAIGGALVAAGWGPSGALAGVAIGYVASGLLALGPQASKTSISPGRVEAPSFSSLAAILVVSIAMAVPTSVDVALVKHFFPAVQAGMFTAVAVLGRIVLFVPLAISYIALPKVVARVSGGGDPSPLLRSSLIQTGAVASSAALLLLFLTTVLGWTPAGDISGVMTPLYWYLTGMVAFAFVATFTYYQIGRGNFASVFALLIPGTIAQPLLIILFHGSLTAVAQVVFAVNLLLLAACLLPAALTQVKIWHLPWVSRDTERNKRILHVGDAIPQRTVDAE